MAVTTWNPADKDGLVTLSNGNLTFTGTDGVNSPQNTYATPSKLPNTGKFYFEVKADSLPTYFVIGLVGDTRPSRFGRPGHNNDGITFLAGGYGSIEGFGPYQDLGTAAAVTAGQFIGVALDTATGAVSFYRNGTQLGSTVSSAQSSYTPVVGPANAESGTANFGATAFNNPPPMGYVAWNTDAVGTEYTPTFTVSSAYNNTNGYAGDGSGMRDGRYNDANTAWTGNGNSSTGDWITADLGSAMKVATIGIAPMSSNGASITNNVGVRLQYSNDNTNWTAVFQLASGGVDRRTDYYSINNGSGISAHYWRLYKGAGDGDNSVYFGISEFRMFAASGPAGITAQSSTIDASDSLAATSTLRTVTRARLVMREGNGSDSFDDLDDLTVDYPQANDDTLRATAVIDKIRATAAGWVSRV
ncbi:MAG: hypothetical protein EOO77_15225, partial [Oxalobacteraceae bacterium]